MARQKSKKPIKYYSPKRRKVYACGDSINALVLFDLYGWTCYICKDTIDRRKRLPDWNAGTIEHLTPISKGGTHTWDNCVPAHARCNFNKGDLSLDEYTVILSA